MGKTRDLFKKMRYQGNISCKDGHNKGQKGKDLTEAKRLRRGGTNTQKNYTKKVFNDLDNHDGVITHLDLGILKCEVK